MVFAESPRGRGGGFNERQTAADLKAAIGRRSLRSLRSVEVPGLVKIQKTMVKITMFNMFNGKINYFDWAIFKFANC